MHSQHVPATKYLLWCNLHLCHAGIPRPGQYLAPQRPRTISEEQVAYEVSAATAQLSREASEVDWRIGASRDPSHQPSPAASQSGSSAGDGRLPSAGRDRVSYVAAWNPRGSCSQPAAL